MSKKAVKSRRDFLKIAGTAAATTVMVASSPIANLASAKIGSRKPRWGFLIDLDRCVGCKACAVACKTEFEVPLGVFRSSVKEYGEGKYPKVKRLFVPWLCNHCGKPACLPDCPVDEIEASFTWPDNSVQKFKKRATYQRPDGIVLVDQDRCVGCGNCVDACPYKVRFLNPAKKTISPDAVGDHPADKCTLCIHRLEAGLVPACVNTCQGKARIVGDLNDSNSEISRVLNGKSTAVLLAEAGTQPQCSYVSLNSTAYSKGKDTR